MVDDSKSALQRVAAEIERAIGDLFEVHDLTLGIPQQPDVIRLRGRLLAPSHKAYPQIAKRLRGMGYTAVLRHDPDSDQDVLLANPGVMPQESGTRPWLNILLFVLTVLSTLFVGATWSDQVPPSADILWILRHLWVGWPFALSLMLILTGHELGHYFAGRFHRVPVSLPYFIPLPLPPLGTMGAVILMKGRSVNRRQMLTVGLAGPLTGFVIALPILLLGLSMSTVQPMTAPEPGAMVFLEGNSLLYLLLKFTVFGQILPGSGMLASLPGALGQIGAALFGTFPIDSGYDVFVHPVALAGWAGLLVTGLNLLPVGQLDGGHILYSLVGQRARMLTWPVIGLLLIMGFFLWSGWFVWAALLFLFGRSHPEPLDDVTRLDPPRKVLAVVMLVIFVLIFTPLPMRVVIGQTPLSDLDQATNCLGAPALVLGAIAWFMWKARARASARSDFHPPSQ
jgi:membrane-associated protease RseP (regulator of RpoE activity)